MIKFCFNTLLFIFLLGKPVYAQGKYDLLIGTYTDTGKSEGIYVYTFDTNNGELTYKNKVGGIDNPSYLTLSADLKYVYAVSEYGKDSPGAVHAYAYDAKSGSLIFKNKKSSAGVGPCYISTDQAGKYVFTANYGSGSLGAIPIEADGSLGNLIQKIQHKGKGRAPQQDHARVHAVVLSPDEGYLFATDLGADKIGVYRYNADEKKPLDPFDVVKLPSGSGPRHFTFHPNGKYAYVIQEIDGGITAFNYKEGKLDKIQSISMLPDGFNGKFAAADIHLSDDGKFLYASNRIDLNEVLVYTVNPSNGFLTYRGKASSMGEVPRNFTLDPSGKYVLVANQNSDEIAVFERNANTGVLRHTGKKLQIGRPVCLKFVVK